MLVIEVFILPLLSEIFDIFSLGSLIISILIGLYGNSLYMQHIDQHIDRDALMDPVSRTNYQNRYGGTSWTLVWICLAITLGINIVASFLFSFTESGGIFL